MHVSRDPVEFLRPEDRCALLRTCEVVGIPWWTWRRIGWLREHFELLAVEAEADRVRVEWEKTGQRAGRMKALAEAASRVGIVHETHRTRLARALRCSLDPTKDPTKDPKKGSI